MSLAPAIAGVIILCLLLAAALDDNVTLRLELARLRAVKSAPVPLPPPESQCAAWLFNTDLAHAKARICGSKEKSPGAK